MAKLRGKQSNNPIKEQNISKCLFFTLIQILYLTSRQENISYKCSH